MIDSVRERYPILKKKTYLASHSLGAVPESAAAAVREYYDAWAEQGIQAWEGPWWNAMLDFNQRIESILSADAGTVIPMENVTRGMAAVASCLDFRGKRNRVVMTDLEFTTSYPFWRGTESLGAELVIVKSEDGIHLPVEKLIAAIDERTLIVPTSHVYFRSGTLQNLGAIVEAAHGKGAYVLGDGYQTVGTVPVDVKKLGIDFYVGGCHKWLCGGPGAGYLYVRKDLIDKLQPSLTGWFGIQSPFTYEPGTALNPHEGIFRFLGGTVNVPGLFAAREGIKNVQEVGLPRIREISKQMTTWIVEQADRRGLQVRSPRDAEQRSGMVCVEFEGSKEACEALVKQGIVLDWRPNCGIRVSPHFYNRMEELERFFQALDEIRVPN